MLLGFARKVELTGVWKVSVRPQHMADIGTVATICLYSAWQAYRSEWKAWQSHASSR